MPFVARKGDMSSGHDSCPGVPIVDKVSSDVLINGRNVACVGDAESCGGTIVTGSTDVSVG